MASKIRTRVWRNGTLEAEDFPFEKVSDYLEDPDCVVWADVLEPDEQTISQVAEELSLDQHAVEDALDRDERPKAMRYPTHLFLTMYVLNEGRTGKDAIGRVSAFLVRRGMVTVRLDDSLDTDALLERWEQNSDLLKFGARALAHGLLDLVVDGYFDVLQGLDDRIEDVEDILFDDDTDNDDQVSKRIFGLRRSLVQARRAILPMREVVLTSLRHATQGGHDPELTPYYEDLYDHTLRAADWTDSLREMVASVFDTNMSMSDVRMNTIMKKLTGYAAIIAVPTAVTGYFGQNIPYPGFGKVWGFWLSVGIIVAIALLLFAVFRRKDWL